MKVLLQSKLAPSIIKLNKFTFCRAKFNFSFKNNISFPYKFGGVNKNLIMDVPEDVRHQNRQLLHFIFGSSILKNFTNAYRELIKGLHEKDQSFVKQILQKNLTKNLKFPQTKALNLQANIQPIVGKFNMVLYGCYDREILQKLHIVKYKSTQDKQLNACMAVSQSEPSLQKILFTVNIYFKSTIKLVNQQSKELEQTATKQLQQSEQYHVVQFQVQNNFKRRQMFFKMFGILFRNLFNKQQMIKQYLNEIIGVNKQNFNWKIGDIDHLLKGNHTWPQE